MLHISVVLTAHCHTHAGPVYASPLPQHRCPTCDVLFCDECLRAQGREGGCPGCGAALPYQAMQ